MLKTHVISLPNQKYVFNRAIQTSIQKLHTNNISERNTKIRLRLNINSKYTAETAKLLIEKKKLSRKNSSKIRLKRREGKICSTFFITYKTNVPQTNKNEKILRKELKSINVINFITTKGKNLAYKK